MRLEHGGSPTVAAAESKPRRGGMCVHAEPGNLSLYTKGLRVVVVWYIQGNAGLLKFSSSTIVLAVQGWTLSPKSSLRPS